MNNLGDLTVANDANNSIAIFRARQLKGGGAVNPGLSLSVPLTTLNAATGLIYGAKLRATSKP